MDLHRMIRLGPILPCNLSTTFTAMWAPPQNNREDMIFLGRREAYVGIDIHELAETQEDGLIDVIP